MYIVDDQSILIRYPRTIANSTDPGYAGEFCYDANYLYYCVADDSWIRTPIDNWNGIDHGDLAGLEDDDHTQYHNDDRADTWHSGLTGAHVTNGDSHDHDGGDGAQIDYESLANLPSLEAFPVDAVFMGMVATNPATLLGYGTWSTLGTTTFSGETVYIWKRTA